MTPLPQDLPTSLGYWIRQRRRALDITQEALAAAAGLSVSAIRKIEADERHPSPSVAEALATALQIPSAQSALFIRVAWQESRIDQLGVIANPVVQPARTDGGEGSAPTQRIDSQAPASGDSSPRASDTPSLTVPGTEGLFRGRLVALPAFPTPLVGREAEISQIAATMLNPECRLLSLTGAGGIGKTRLAVAAAAPLAGSFSDGAIFVALAAIQARERPIEQSAPVNVGAANPLAIALANTLRLRAQNPDELLGHIVSYLADKNLLIVLDNLEHLLEGGAEVVAEVLEGAPAVKILATTREQLNLQSEWVFNVRGLGAPVASAFAMGMDVAESWQSSSAMRLFVQSARRALVGFDPAADEVVAIAEICRRVDGIPLAVELAASWVRVLTCAEIAEEIARDWTFLSGATRDMPERHRSMRAVFEHSWRYLTSAEQRLLRQLSVFRGGFRRDAAQAVAGATLQDLAGLMSKSLVNGQLSGQANGQLNGQLNDRYDLHELVRQYADEQLAGAGETELARDRHAAWYIQLATSSEDALHGPQQAMWLQRLDADIQNFESALRWITSDESTLAAGEGWRMISALWWFCFVRGYWNDLYNWLMYFYRLDPPVESSVRAIALGRTGNLAWLRGETQLAEKLIAEAQAEATRSGNAIAIAMSWYATGQVYSQSDPPRSLAAYQESLAITRRMGRRWGEGRSLFRVGSAIMDTDELARALAHFDEALAIFRQLGDLWGIYAVLSDTVDVYLRQGRPELVAQAGREALANARQLGFRQGIALEALSLGIASWHMQQFDEASDWFDEARTLFIEIDNQRGVAQIEIQLGHVARMQGDYSAARNHYAAGDRIMRELGTELTRGLALDGLAQLALIADDLAAARRLLSEAIISQVTVPALRHSIPSLIETAARIAAKAGDWKKSARLIGAAEAGRMRYASAQPLAEREAYRELVASVRGALGEAYAPEYAAGVALQEEAVVAMIRDL